MSLIVHGRLVGVHGNTVHIHGNTDSVHLPDNATHTHGNNIRAHVPGNTIPMVTMSMSLLALHVSISIVALLVSVVTMLMSIHGSTFGVHGNTSCLLLVHTPNIAGPRPSSERERRRRILASYAPERLILTQKSNQQGLIQWTWMKTVTVESHGVVQCLP